MNVRVKLPSKPGIYRFLDSRNKVLYVGKAKDLKKRVSQYFLKNRDKKTTALMSHVVDIEITITENENQALLLESNLIKTLHPKYNILLRDDKDYPYLLLSDHEFPRLNYHRGERQRSCSNDKARYFGPYPNAGSVRNNLALIQKLFKLRQCSDIFFKSRSRPCLQYQMNRCTAPCVQHVSQTDYAQQVQDAILFLTGKNNEITQSIENKMAAASAHCDYENAMHYRDLLIRLRKLQAQQFVAGGMREWISIAITNATDALKQHQTEKNNILLKLEALQKKCHLPNLPKRIECFDISHTMGDATKASCVVFGVDGPVKKAYRQFNIEDITPGDDYAAMQQVITRRYTKLKTGDKLLPNLIIVDGGKGQLKIAAHVLELLQMSDVMLMGIAKGVTRKPGCEHIFIWGHESTIHLTSDDPVLHLLQFIRDEAHRFAITAHRKKRAKKSMQSILDTITGVGKKRKMDLLKHFGGLQELKKASMNEIAKVKGINSALAKIIYDMLHE